MLTSPGNSSASSRHHRRCVNLAKHHLIMKTPMCGVVAEEGAVDVVGVGAEEVMVDMETTKAGTIKAGTIKVDTIKAGTTKMVGTTIIKADTTKMVVTMIIKVGMVVDMATTKADKETTKKMVDITEDGVVCVEEAIGVTVGDMSEGTEQRQNFHGLLVLFKCMLYNIRGKVSCPRIFFWKLSFVWVLVVSPERDVWL